MATYKEAVQGACQSFEASLQMLVTKLSFRPTKKIRKQKKRREKKKSTDSIQINTNATDVSHLHVSADGMDAAQPPVSTDNMDASHRAPTVT